MSLRIRAIDVTSCGALRLGAPICVARPPIEAGFTLIELIVSFTILLVLSTMALPIARFQVRRAREKELRYALLDMRKAIDKYKDMCDAGKITGKMDEYCYPPTLDVLVDGVKMNNVITGLGQGSGKVRFLRRIPKDPFTGDTDWGKRSMQDDPTSSSWGGQNVFDVYSKTSDLAPDGTAYAEW
jgi:general secretion pathway protein G